MQCVVLFSDLLGEEMVFSFGEEEAGGSLFVFGDLTFNWEGALDELPDELVERISNEASDRVGIDKKG